MRSSVYRPVVCAALLSALGAACRKSEGPVVAQVGNIAITTSEFTNRLMDTPEGYQQYVASPEGRRQFLNLMIREKVLLYEARQAGLQRDPSYRKAVDEFKTQWQRKLKDYQESLLVQSYLRKLRSTELSVTDAEVEKYYDDHRDDYQHPVEVQASHILLSTPEDAQKALQRISNGDSFETVAKEMSKDPATAERGGKLNPFRRGSLVPEFEEAAFQLKVGETSSVVKTMFGYHIIRKTGEKVLPAQSLASVKEGIRARLERDKFDRWVADKQNAIGVHVDSQAMATVSVPSETAAVPSEESPKP
ncbi:MAG TPA: peptidylprolyl isomerase [Elusimicrobiota bacterium]|nr:peptidylprolyl isomerase [Elusimicrobiota bacterium]